MMTHYKYYANASNSKYYANASKAKWGRPPATFFKNVTGCVPEKKSGSPNGLPDNYLIVEENYFSALASASL
jgi:hypothetical protein